jgi:hypothetical protein
MKLQINDAGSWRHISNFNAIDESGVRLQAPKLMVIVNERATLRILDDKGNVRAYCKGPNFNWEQST